MKRILSLIAFIPIAVSAQDTTHLNNQYNFYLELPKESVIKTDLEYVCIAQSSNNFERLTFAGNIRMLDSISVGKVYNYGNSIIMQAELSDTIYNYGKLQINLFKSTDTVYVINSGTIKIKDETVFDGADGNCGSGYIKIINQVTSLPNLTKSEQFEIIDLDRYIRGMYIKRYKSGKTEKIINLKNR